MICFQGIKSKFQTTTLKNHVELTIEIRSWIEDLILLRFQVYIHSTN